MAGTPALARGSFVYAILCTDINMRSEFYLYWKDIQAAQRKMKASGCQTARHRYGGPELSPFMYLTIDHDTKLE